MTPERPRGAGPLNATPRARRVLEHAAPDGTPFLTAVVRRMIAGDLPQTTLLAVCPTSIAVTRATLSVARQADTPAVFAATLNQVDTDGGYTGWTPDVFAGVVAAEAARIGLDTPILLGLDHAGPWLNDAHARDGLSYDATMDAVLRSIEACLRAGYALLHIDPTVDRTLPPGAPVPIARVVERTVAMIAHAEGVRTKYDLPRVAYEVGTEEVHGGLAHLDTVDRFLAGLDAGLRAAGLRHAWPTFVVGKVGTDLHTATFDADVARALTARVRAYGSLVKGHYSDFVTHPEAYPQAGMGGANLGPELTDVEARALEDLADAERALGRDSGIEAALASAVEDSGRWTKWLLPDEAAVRLADLTPERRRWMVRTGARYVWTDPAVTAARARLATNLEGVRDAEAYVQGRIEAAIGRYVRSFHLVGLNERLLGLHRGDG